MIERKSLNYGRSLGALVISLLTGPGSAEVLAESSAVKTDIEMTWVEKYMTYEQGNDGQLRLTDVHFLAEIIFDGARDFDAISASLYAGSDTTPLATYGGHDKRAFTNGYFYTRKTQSYDDLDALEKSHPPDQTFSWEINGPNGHLRLDPIHIGGPGGSTQIPNVSTIRLLQNDALLKDLNVIDASLPMTIAWDPFVIGGPLEDTEWDDLVFVLISDCHGEVVFTGGAPGTDEVFVDYSDVSVVAGEGTLKPGRDYTVFISQVNYVDHNKSHGITQLAANSFATELAVHTAGTLDMSDCPSPPRKAEYLWSRKTAGNHMEGWPTLVDYW